MFVIAKIEPLNIKNMLKNILPIVEIGSNFTGCYLLFYLLIPFINILIKNMKEKQHLMLIAILLFIFTILGNIPIIEIRMNYISWFFVIYLIGAFISLYPKRIFKNRKFWNALTLILICLCAFSIVICLHIGQKINTNITYYFVADSNKILAVLTSVSIFLCFKNMRIRQSNIINRVASSIFGVLLIHANSDTMRNWLWKNTLKNTEVFSLNNNDIYLHAIISISIVFIVCTIIDQIRIKFIETPFFKVTENKIRLYEDKLKNIWIKRNI